jgi:hypothetical protein
MKFTTSTYYIEVLEGKIAKRVPHTKGTKNCDFLTREQAVDFLRKLVANNPPNKFRLVKESTTETEGPWMTKELKPITRSNTYKLWRLPILGCTSN